MRLRVGVLCVKGRNTVEWGVVGCGVCRSGFTCSSFSFSRSCVGILGVRMRVVDCGVYEWGAVCVGKECGVCRGRSVVCVGEECGVCREECGVCRGGLWYVLGRSVVCIGGVVWCV